MYLFFDEVQRLDGWENAVNSFRVDFDCDIYITGSNAHLLSTELSTYLSGQYVEIKVLPLSFREFLDFHGYTITDSLLLRKLMMFLADNLLNLYWKYPGQRGIADGRQSKSQTRNPYHSGLFRSAEGFLYLL